MSSFPLVTLLATSLLAAACVGGFLLYITIRYSPIVARIFVEKPLFLPLRVPPREEDGQEVRFSTQDGMELAGTYLPARTGSRIGVLVFCHEYLSDRWSCLPYADSLRDLGFDLFTFDFRNHGSSSSDPAYKPFQWVTEREVHDLRAALAYLRSRPDHDPAGCALFGISRGGGTALVVGAKSPSVWGVITDGAFPTQGTMLAYILRWAEIYVGSPYFWRWVPTCFFGYLAWVGRLRSQYTLGHRFPSVEKAVARLAPRPWLMIHGQKDAYIGTSIAERLFAEAREPKECWIVPAAKHNRCREVQPVAYQERIASFLARSAPRRPLPVVERERLPVAVPRLQELSSSGVF